MPHELKQNEIKTKQLIKFNEQDLIQLNVRGFRAVVPYAILTSIENSSLSTMFSGRHEIECVNGDPYIDRDPVIFKIVLDILKHRVRGIEIRFEQIFLINEEMKFWNLIQKSISELYLDSNVQSMMIFPPKYQHNYPEPLQTWKRLGVLDLEHLNEINPIDFTKKDYLEGYIDNGYYKGQVKDGQQDGIGRQNWNMWEEIYEGQFKDGKRDGYVRQIYQNGSYFIGFWKNKNMHREGKMFNSDETIYKQGKWQNGEFIEEFI